MITQTGCLCHNYNTPCTTQLQLNENHNLTMSLNVVHISSEPPEAETTVDTRFNCSSMSALSTHF